MAEVLYNPVAASCTLSSCINQVAGFYDHNTAAQLSSCQSVFGFPAVPTVTLTAEDVVLTRTSTHTDVVIVVTTSTAYSTAEETSTAHETLYSTATEYTTSITSTISTTVSAAPTILKRASDKLKRRGRSKPKTTTLSEEPVPSNCANLNDYSSACACIEPTTVTEYAGTAATSITDETVTVSAPSTRETVVTVSVTIVVVKPATTSIVSTLSTQTIATTTVTSTIVPAPAIPTVFGLVITSPVNQGTSIISIGTGPAYSIVWRSADIIPTKLRLPYSGGPLSISGQPFHEMYIRLSTTSYGAVFFFTTQSYIASSGYTWIKATCSVASDTLQLSYTAGSGDKNHPVWK